MEQILPTGEALPLEQLLQKFDVPVLRPWHRNETRDLQILLRLFKGEQHREKKKMGGTKPHDGS